MELGPLSVPALIADLGEHAALRFVDLFTANIRNPNTRAAYAVAVHESPLAGETRAGRSRRNPHASRLHLCRGAGPNPQSPDGETAPRGDPHAVRRPGGRHMNVEDYYPQGKRWWVRLHEKGGKQHEMPCHHLLETYIDAYVTAAGIGAEKTGALFRTLGGRGRKRLSSERMSRQDARRMIVRRALQAGIITKLGCHTFRATGITVYLLNAGLLEYAQQMAAHESARTTKLYDRRNDQVTLDQVGQIVL